MILILSPASRSAKSSSSRFLVRVSIMGLIAWSTTLCGSLLTKGITLLDLQSPEKSLQFHRGDSRCTPRSSLHTPWNDHSTSSTASKPGPVGRTVAAKIRLARYDPLRDKPKMQSNRTRDTPRH